MKPIWVTALLIACSDNQAAAPDAPAPLAPDAGPFTWGDAEAVWIDAWCMYAQRCYPDEFEAQYGALGSGAATSFETCVVLETANQCAVPYRTHPCSEVFPPELRDDLQLCHDQMVEISCEATMAPQVCYGVWQ